MQVPKNKYRKGYHYYSIGHLFVHLEQGRWVYWHETVMHPGRIRSMTLQTVAIAIRNNCLCEAIDQKQEYSRAEYQLPYPEGVTERKRK